MKGDKREEGEGAMQLVTRYESYKKTFIAIRKAPFHTKASGCVFNWDSHIRDAVRSTDAKQNEASERKQFNTMIFEEESE